MSTFKAQIKFDKIYFFGVRVLNQQGHSRQTEDWFWNEETEQPTCQRRHLLAVLFIIYFRDEMYRQCTLNKSPQTKETQPESRWRNFVAVLFIIYFMDVKLYWYCSLSKRPVKLTHTETGWKLFPAVLFSFYYLLYECESSLTVHPEQVPDEEDPPWDWLQTFSHRYFYYLLYGCIFYIDLSLWAGPLLRRPTWDWLITFSCRSIYYLLYGCVMDVKTLYWQFTLRKSSP